MLPIRIHESESLGGDLRSDEHSGGILSEQMHFKSTAMPSEQHMATHRVNGFDLGGKISEHMNIPSHNEYQMRGVSGTNSDNASKLQ